MRLFIDTMDAVLVDFDADGRVRFDGEDWSTPSLQETRAIIYAARNEHEALDELVEVMERQGAIPPSDPPA